MDRPTLLEAVSCFRRKKKADNGTLSCFLSHILEAADGGDLVPVEVQFYQSHKVVVDAVAMVL